jgi:hypothetical protein
LATSDYTVVMPVVSVRFSSDAVHERLRRAAHRRGVALSGLAEQLIDEGLRMADHPMIVFRGGPAGRRPALAGGPDVAEIVGAVVGGDVPPELRTQRAAELLGLSAAQVDAAMSYYAEYTDEVDGDVAANATDAERQEALWRRQRELLAR